MSKFTKALEIIGVSPKENQDSFEDDYFEDDFKDDAEEIKPRTSKETARSTASSERSQRYSGSRYGQKREVLDDADSGDSGDTYSVRQSRSRLSAIRGGASAPGKTMVIHAPASYPESQSLVLQLKQNKQIIIKLDTVEKTEAQRILDFMSGAAFALECQVIKISKGIYLFASNDTRIEKPDDEDADNAPADDFYSVDETRRR